MKLFLFTITFLLLSGCKDNVVNHYIDVPTPAIHDTLRIYIDRDSTGHDGDNDGEHGHHKKPHKDKGDD